MNPQQASEDSGPWWKHGHVWLVISGPAIVVVAALFTGWIAMTRPDPVIESDYYRRGIEINKTLAARALTHAPAEKARIHAATPAAD